MTQVWKEVLGLEQIGRNDNFFELGGDSLLAARLVFRIREVFESPLPLRELFRCQNVAALTAALGSGRAEPHRVPAHAAGEADSPRLASSAVQPQLPWPTPLPPPVPDRGGSVLLTGATGFFGAFLLREILARYRGPVHCLVRAEDPAQARDKIRVNLERYGLADEVLAQSRIRVVVGDLARPRLGLTGDEYDRLADEIELIIHNGAHVDVLHSYDTLEAANVRGTRELLVLAATTWLKPLRFVSTSSAAGYRPSVTGNGDSASGYLESKWRAEQVVTEAQEHGIPAAMYRVPRLAGDSRTGRGNDRDIILRTLRWILELGAAPDVELAGDWIPVDEAARLLVGHRPGPEDRGSFVLTAQQPIYLTEIVEFARRIGHEIEYQPSAEWRRGLVERSAEEHEVLTSALGFDSTGEQAGESNSAPRPDSALEGFVPIVAHGVTEQVLRRYLNTMSPVQRTE